MFDLTAAGFKRWLKTKPAATSFVFADIEQCALAEYLKAQGCTGVSVGGHTLNADGKTVNIPTKISDALHGAIVEGEMSAARIIAGL